MDDSVLNTSKIDQPLLQRISTLTDSQDVRVSVIIQYARHTNTLNSDLPLSTADIIVYRYPELPFVCA